VWPIVHRAAPRVAYFPLPPMIKPQSAPPAAPPAAPPSMPTAVEPSNSALFRAYVLQLAAYGRPSASLRAMNTRNDSMTGDLLSFGAPRIHNMPSRAGLGAADPACSVRDRLGLGVGIDRFTFVPCSVISAPPRTLPHRRGELGGEPRTQQRDYGAKYLVCPAHGAMVANPSF